MSQNISENVFEAENCVPRDEIKPAVRPYSQSSHSQSTSQRSHVSEPFEEIEATLRPAGSSGNNANSVNSNNSNNNFNHTEDDEELDDSNGADEKTLPSCAQCGRPVRNSHAPRTINGPLHASCVLEYRFLHQPRCYYCDIRFREEEATSFVKDPSSGYLYHPDCASREARGLTFVRPTMEGYVRKQAVARSKLSPKNWKVRYFVLSPANNGIRYYSEDPTGRNTRQSALLLMAANGSATANAGVADSNTLHPGSSQPSYNEDLDRMSSGSDNNNEESAEASVVAVCRNPSKKSKGVVLLDRRSRLITHPALSLYHGSGPALPTHTDLIIIFYDSPESKVERRMLFECKDVEERSAWTRALEAYVHIVDDPSDYKRKTESSE